SLSENSGTLRAGTARDRFDCCLARPPIRTRTGSGRQWRTGRSNGTPAAPQSRVAVTRSSHSGRNFRGHVEALGGFVDSPSVRIFKEARLLLWTWLAVIAAAAAKVVAISSPVLSVLNVASAAGFYIGIPLLAALPFGEEFQQRTLAFL